MFFRGVTYIIPGVFEDAKASPAINGPLWSLPFELWLYVLLFLFFLVGGRRISLWVLAGAVVLSVVWGATPTIGDITIGPFDSFQFSRLGSFFLSGALLAFWWPSIENHAVTIGAAALLATFLIHYLLPINTIFHSLAVAATVVGLGNSKSMAWFSRGGRCIVRDVHFCVATTTIFLVASWLVLVVHDRGILSHDGTRICDVAHF
jgi:peptidoglycan/LPS O-acetylase OafA/YrhL